MELQELALRAITIQLRFRLAPRFADVRGTLIEELQEAHGLSEYGWGDAQLDVHDLERTRNMVVGSRELRISYEQIDRLESFMEAASAFLTRGLDVLHVQTVEFVGVRSYWIAAVDSFEELAAWMLRRLSPDEPFSGAIGTRPSDAGWVFEYHGDENPWHTVRVGPMTVDQLVGQVLATNQRDLFPDQFFFLDLDRVYQKAEIPAGDAVARAAASVDKSQAIGRKIAAWLGEDKDSKRR